MTQKLIADFDALPAEAQRQVADLIVALHGRQGGALLSEHGINPQQAAELRAALAPFEDWNNPEMSIYDNYDDAQTDLSTR